MKNIDHGYKGKCKLEYNIDKLDVFNNVTIKLIEPNILLKPAKCNEKNIRSMDEGLIVDKGT